MEIEIVSLIAVVWTTLWLQLVVIPFITKREKLYQLFHQSGAIDAAQSRIDSDAVLPELASIFERAIDQREDARRKIEIEDLLVRFSFSESLEKLGEAVASKAKINSVYQKLKKIAKYTWITGVLHVVLLALALVIVYLAPERDYAMTVAIVIGTLCICSAVASLLFLFSFDSKHARLMDLVELRNA